MSQPACTHCREKKIRCGRETPQCASCQRDGVNCSYSNPTKRVNHIKLLCNNVGDLEDRLASIEDKLSDLASSIAYANRHMPSHDSGAEDPSSKGFERKEIISEPISSISPRYHILRASRDLRDRCHGPFTLFSLCSEFSETMLLDDLKGNQSRQKVEQDALSNFPELKEALSNLCIEAGAEAQLDLQVEQRAIRLPPRHLLSTLPSLFSQQLDYTTDLFVQSHFWSNVDQIYCRGIAPSDEAWEMCLDAIILRVTRSTIMVPDTEPRVRAQFTRSLLSTVRAALSCSRILTTPKLINVQALALVSVVAQQFCSPGLAESIFAQACMLARMMGLQHDQAMLHSISPEEAEERSKVFRSLFLRDKSLAISRGSMCWLPSFDCGVTIQPNRFTYASSSPSTESSGNWDVRAELAGLQEEVYQRFQASHAQHRSQSEQNTSLLAIRQRLDRLVETCDVFNRSCPDNYNYQLQLEILATRILVFRGSFETEQNSEALRDARASCLILLIVSGRHEQPMLGRLKKLALSKSSSISDSPDQSVQLGPGRASPAPGLLDAFSVSAFFLLLVNVILSDSRVDDAETHEDLSMLQMVCACFEGADINIQTNSYVRKVARVFRRLLDIASLLKRSHQRASPQDNTVPDPNHNRMLAQDVFDGLTDLPELVEQPYLSHLSVLTPEPWEFLAVDSSPSTASSRTIRAEDASIRDLSKLTVPGQTLNPQFEPTLVDPSFQPQSSPIRERKRPRLSNPDEFVANIYQDSFSPFTLEPHMIAFNCFEPVQSMWI
ncbi:hypothetical protein F5884DRAFT_686596 [Xylogone sp. PMI_703]|nr:hypothetical protein F5884DRAFT_686596 [Xylogone sp. PMI_703]